MPSEIHKNDIGTRFLITIKDDGHGGFITAYNQDQKRTLYLGTGKDENGYVAAVACECLVRMNTNSSIKFALNYLNDRKCDDTLMGGTKVY